MFQTLIKLMNLEEKYIEIQRFLSISDSSFDLKSIINEKFKTEELKLEILSKILTFIYYFQMFKNIREFMTSVYNCIKNTLQIKLTSIDDFDELLIKNAIMRFIQEYIDYANISQKEQVLNFLADSFERLGVQPLIINLGLLLKPMYSDQSYLDKKSKLEEEEVIISDDEISSKIKLAINDWLEQQALNLDKQDEIKENMLKEFNKLAEEYNLSKDSESYKKLLTEVNEMLAMRLTMLSLMESIGNDLEPVSIK
ncbi:MAG: hypothetical protein ACP6IY_02890 [Promethearchaeia archaeon]